MNSEKINDMDLKERELFYIKKRGCLKKYEDYKKFESINNNFTSQNYDIRTFLTMAITFEKKKYDYEVCMER